MVEEGGSTFLEQQQDEGQDALLPRDALVESYGISQCYDLLDYYFKIAENPTWNYFAYNAEKILNGKLEVEQDIKERKERRELARKWISE